MAMKFAREFCQRFEPSPAALKRRGPSGTILVAATLFFVFTQSACPPAPAITERPDAPFRPVVFDAGNGRLDGGDVVNEDGGSLPVPFDDGGVFSDGGKLPLFQDADAGLDGGQNASNDDGGTLFNDGGFSFPNVFAADDARVYEGVDPEVHSISLIGRTGGTPPTSLLLDLFTSTGSLLISDFEIDVEATVAGGRFIAQGGLSGLTGLDVVRYSIRDQNADGLQTGTLLADVEPLAALGQSCHVQGNPNVQTCRFSTFCHDANDGVVGDFIGQCANASSGAPVLDSVTYAGPMDSTRCDPASNFPSGLRWTFSGSTSENIVAFDVQIAGGTPTDPFSSLSVGLPPLFSLSDGLCFTDAESFAGETLVFRVYDAAGRVSNAQNLVFPLDLGFPTLADAPILEEAEIRVGRAVNTLAISLLVEKIDVTSTLLSASFNFFDIDGVDVLGGPDRFDLDEITIGDRTLLQITLEGTEGLGITSYRVFVRDDQGRASNGLEAEVLPTGVENDECFVAQEARTAPCITGLICDSPDVDDVKGFCTVLAAPPPVLDSVTFDGFVAANTGYCVSTTDVGASWTLSGTSSLVVTEASMALLDGTVFGGPVPPSGPPMFSVSTGLCFPSADGLFDFEIAFSVTDEAGQSSNFISFVLPSPDDAGVLDAGLTSTDAGVLDAGSTSTDAGVLDAGLTSPDAGTFNAGPTSDAGISDAGSTTTDAGSTTTDAGSTTDRRWFNNDRRWFNNDGWGTCSGRRRIGCTRGAIARILKSQVPFFRSDVCLEHSASFFA
ncbi:MAG: hypothetical protein GY822_13250 [Deltaproteobacteria bacterium]|nr:hypothetical protein [Deltaproteobacteria bacterium]